MLKFRKKNYILDHDLYVLVFCTALVYYLYQHLIIHTAVNSELHSCLYHFWLADGVFSPFHMFTAIVVLITFLGFAIGVRDISKKKLNTVRISVLIVFFCVMFFWAKALYGMHLTFEFEKGNISHSKYFKTESKKSRFYLLEEFDGDRCQRAIGD